MNDFFHTESVKEFCNLTKLLLLNFSFRIHDTDIIQLPYLQEISAQILLKSKNGPVMQLPSNNKKNFKVTENIDGQVHCVVKVTTQ